MNQKLEPRKLETVSVVIPYETQSIVAALAIGLLLLVPTVTNAQSSLTRNSRKTVITLRKVEHCAQKLDVARNL